MDLSTLNRTEPAKSDDALFTRSFNVTELAGKDASKRSIDVIASTADEDSYEEIVEQSWILDRYLANPVVLFEHRSWRFSSDPHCALPIGFATNVRVQDDKLKATLTFVDEKANPLAEQIYQSFLQGSLRAVSVGFMPRNVRMEKRDGREMFILSDNELHEISVVGIPANPNAVVEAKKKSLGLARRLAGLPPVQESTQQAVPASPAASTSTSALPEHPMPTAAEIAAAALAAKSTTTPDPAPAALPEPEPAIPVASLAKALECDNSEGPVFVAIDRLRSAEKTLSSRAALALVCLTALGLAADATEAQVTEKCVDLAEKAAKLAKLEPEIEAAQKAIGEFEAKALETELSWLVSRGAEYKTPVAEADREVVATFRKHNPEGYATRYKAALDGLKAFDKADMFKAITGPGGALGTSVERSQGSTDGTASDVEFDSRVDAYVAKKLAEGKPVTKSDAMDAVLRGRD